MALNKKDTPKRVLRQKTAGVREKTTAIREKTKVHKNTKVFSKEKMQEILKAYCDRIRSGLPLKACFHPDCSWETFCRLEEQFPDVILQSEIQKAKAERAEKFMAIGIAQATGKIAGSSKAWSMIMKNILGWTDAGGVEVDERDKSLLSLKDLENEEEMARKRLRDAVRNGEQWAMDYLLKRQDTKKQDDEVSSLVNYLRQIDGKTKDLTKDDDDD